MRVGSTQGRIYNWQPDLPDFRDWRYARSARLPGSVDLRALCTPVKDQGQLGSCTGNAIAEASEFLTAPNTPELSRLFIYYVERHMEGTVPDDSGAVIRDGIKGLADMGICLESLCPYDITKFTEMPSAEAFADAQDRQIKSYLRIDGLDAMKQCLAEGFPFVFGFAVYRSFESEEVARTGVVPMPGGSGDPQLGGHAVLAVGYDDQTQRVLVRNSWGAGWGMSGYFTMPYDYIGDKNLADDCWTVRREP